VTRDLEILARAVDQDVDAAEILQAADVDGLGRVVAALLRGHARDVAQDLRQTRWLEPVDLRARDDTRPRQRVDGGHRGLGRGDRERVEPHLGLGRRSRSGAEFLRIGADQEQQHGAERQAHAGARTRHDEIRTRTVGGESWLADGWLAEAVLCQFLRRAQSIAPRLTFGWFEGRPSPPWKILKHGGTRSGM
jgi:hypothetical protein